MPAERRLVVVVLLALALPALAGCIGAPTPPQEPLAPTGDGHDHSHDAPPASSGGNLPPTAAFEWSPQPAVVGQPVAFEDRSSDPDDGVGGRVWEFADGMTSQLAKVTHRFEAPGRFLVKLTVSDKAGATDTEAREVLVVAAGSAGPHEDLALDPGAHVVVAVVDTGINPYHEAFLPARPMGAPAVFLEGYPADAKPLQVTRGASYDAARSADEALWAGVEVGQLYWFPGTRIVGAISFGLSTFGNAAANSIPVLDEDGHGTATSSRVAAAGPDVLLVMVEAGATELDEAIAWAANQPWIDVVSVSVGPVGNVPAQWPAYKLDALRLGTRDAWEQGKLVFAAAGNEPTLSATSYISGPPWVIAVGGVLADGRGDPGTASKAMDIVSDYEPPVAMHDSADAVEPRPGTSFSAPTAAGAVGQALHQLRERLGYTLGIRSGLLIDLEGPGLAAGGLANAEVRQAMEGVARYWSTTEWSPIAGVPIAPAPWAQMGWGYLDGDDSAALAEALASGQVPGKPGDAALYMGAVLQGRAAMWA